MTNFRQSGLALISIKKVNSLKTHLTLFGIYDKCFQKLTEWNIKTGIVTDYTEQCH